MAAIETLLKKGKVRQIGVNNFDCCEFKEARAHYPKHDIVSNEIKHNLLKRQIEDNGTLSYCQDEGIEVLAYGPVARVC